VIGNFSFFVFAIHLLDVAISVKALSTILKSITHNGRQVNSNHVFPLEKKNHINQFSWF
jgi:hypothetical protein